MSVGVESARKSARKEQRLKAIRAMFVLARATTIGWTGSKKRAASGTGPF
jgi:hypothetical protein